jgi:hypothetical protein
MEVQTVQKPDAQYPDKRKIRREIQIPA